jgi:hypothetical protein
MGPRLDAELLRGIKANLPALRDLLADLSDRGFEDPIYRFYHHSYKVYGLQNRTEEIVAALRGLLPQRDLDPLFLDIVAEGTGQQFSLDHNANWPSHTRPIVEAFFHARFFLEMAVRYADLPEAPTQLPSGWAALLCLYRLRWRRGGSLEPPQLPSS